jgi:hypothetical protein
MERASTIYLYTSTPPLMCDGRREDKSTRVERQRGSGRPGAAGGCGEFRINCESQDLNSRPGALIPCQASCTSQRNQKSELMERARQFTYTLQHPHSRVTGEEKVNTWIQTGATAIFTINCENQDSNSRPWALIPC